MTKQLPSPTGTVMNQTTLQQNVPSLIYQAVGMTNFVTENMDSSVKNPALKSIFELECYHYSSFNT